MLFGRSDAGGDFERLLVVQDRESGLRAAIVIHSLQRGPAFGGIRRRRYKAEDEAVLEAFGLAETMTLKCALADLPSGGGKAVVFDHSGLEAEAIYKALGRAIQDLNGSYVCGPDLGTGENELSYLRTVTEFVSPTDNDPARYTVAGIVSGLRGLLQVLDGNQILAGKHYVVQGLGSVGLGVARKLIEADARVSACDLSEAACTEASRIGVEILDPATVMEVSCDVFIPCALGNIIDADIAKLAPWRAICGAANNQLASNEAGRILHSRGIYLAPDLCVNAGAVIEGVITFNEGQTEAARAKVEEGISSIADRTADIIQESLKRDEPPLNIAKFRAREKLR